MTAVDRRAKVLADFQEAMNDQEALLRGPEAYIEPLVTGIKAAEQRGDITAEDLREQLEWAGSAQEWAIEELLTRKSTP